ncbi:MAG TPA: biopolymer transporter ExbD [Vicinamibacterales bacterium]|nr:biopolymer transporter ExbD [Vicinamibacterales bacterium]
MAMDVGGAKGGLKADINVTPLVDVLLVLLIIMMLVAPMLQKGVDVKLPQAANTSDKPDTQEQTVLHVTADSRFFVNGVPVDRRDLGDRVASVIEETKEKVVIIKGDADAPYSAIMEAMDDLRRSNIENVGLITERKLRPGESPTGGK